MLTTKLRPTRKKPSSCREAGQVRQFAVVGAERLVKRLTIDIDLAQVALQIIDLIQRYLCLAPPLPDGQRPALPAVLGKHGIQAAGQHPLHIPLEEIPERTDRVASGANSR